MTALVETPKRVLPTLGGAKPASVATPVPAPAPSVLYYPMNRTLLFGAGGSGKTTSVTSILRNPKLKLRVLGLDSNCIAAMVYSIRRMNLSLIPGQVVVSQFVLSPAERAAFVRSFTTAAVGKAKSSGKDWVEKQMGDFTGIDLATGQSESCGGIHTFDQDTVLVIDSWTAFQNHLIRNFLSSNLGADWETYRAVQEYVTNYMTALWACVDCHVIVLAHSKITDKQKGIRGAVIVPDIYGQAAVQSFAGLFSDVLLCRNEGGKPVWVARENGALTAVRNIPLELYPELKPAACPPDFLDPRYSFFPPMEK